MTSCKFLKYLLYSQFLVEETNVNDSSLQRVEGRRNDSDQHWWRQRIWGDAGSGRHARNAPHFNHSSNLPDRKHQFVDNFIIVSNLLIMFSFGIAIRPSTAEILADFIIHKGWTEIIMFTDGDYCKFECFRENYRKHGERTYE